MNDSVLRELLRRRLDLVARLSLATSQMQGWRQRRMAADMDAQRCEMARDDAAQDLQRELHEALCRSDEAESGVARCEALIAEIEQSLAEADREIEASARR
jgi:hypothetical protein